jgi:hypothetical protein
MSMPTARLREAKSPGDQRLAGATSDIQDFGRAGGNLRENAPRVAGRHRGLQLIQVILRFIRARRHTFLLPHCAWASRGHGIGRSIQKRAPIYLPNPAVRSVQERGQTALSTADQFRCLWLWRLGTEKSVPFLGRCGLPWCAEYIAALIFGCGGLRGRAGRAWPGRGIGRGWGAGLRRARGASHGSPCAHRRRGRRGRKNGRRRGTRGRRR